MNDQSFDYGRRQYTLQEIIHKFNNLCDLKALTHISSFPSKLYDIEMYNNHV